MEKSGSWFHPLRAAILIAIAVLLPVCLASSAKAQSPVDTAQHETPSPLKWPAAPAGADRCTLCHRSEVEGYSQFAMAHSLRRAGKEPEGSVTTADTRITVSNRANGYWQRLQSGSQSTDYRIDYVIGSGNHAAGYLLDLEGHLFQSPIAYYTNRHAYDLAPGYEGLRNPDFTRPVTEGCLFCHSGAALPVPGTRNEYHSPPFAAEAITCERCHGPVEKHLEDPRAGTIINPAKLATAARDSVCEQCHLLGTGRVLNPGKKFSDFVPGEPLENVFTTYHLVLPPGAGNGKLKVISHVEQLARSTCSRMSQGRMWCGTCHDPHNKPADPVSYFRNKCLSCHTAAFSAPHPDRNSNCIGCHMPRRNAKDGGHTVFTDHRIERRPSVQQDLPPDVDIAAWREPAPEFQKRNLGMAYVNFGAEHQSPKFIVRGYKLLTEVQHQFPNDDTLFTAIGTALLLGQQPAEAEFAFERVLQLQPNSVSAETNDASAYLRAGDPDQAITHLERAVALDPFDLTAVAPLVDLYRQKGNDVRANELSDKIAGALIAQGQPANASPGASSEGALTAEKRYKNIQMLKGIPADQLIPAMRFITQSLGVQCSYCHVPNHFEDDTRKTKQTARNMMQMMNAINGRNFDGNRAVTCYSCHRGAPKPQSIPSIGSAAGIEVATMHPDDDANAVLPSADEIVEKYIEATGGASAIEAVHTREEHGTVTAGGKVAQIEILHKFPDRHALIRRTAESEDFTILNGRMGWDGTAESFHDLQSSEIDDRELAADLRLPVDLQHVFTGLRTGYPEKIGDREAYVLLGERQDRPAAELFFDEKTGLLIRMVQFTDSPLGLVKTETDYDDYRMIEGVNVPFRLTLAEGNETATVQLDQVLQNAPIEDQRFEKPAQ